MDIDVHFVAERAHTQQVVEAESILSGKADLIDKIKAKAYLVKEENLDKEVEF